MKTFIICFIAILFGFFGGIFYQQTKNTTPQTALLGSWVLEDGDWGFSLYDDFSASSINSATLLYQRWETNKNNLCLVAKSIGNHTQSTSKECREYKISGKGKNTILTLTTGSYTQRYKRYQ